MSEVPLHQCLSRQRTRHLPRGLSLGQRERAIERERDREREREREKERERGSASGSESGTGVRRGGWVAREQGGGVHAACAMVGW